MSLDKLEPLPHLAHQLLFALVRDGNVLDEARKVSRAVPGQHERVSRLAEKVDKVAVVARRNVRQSGKGGEKFFQYIWQPLQRAKRDLT